MESGTFNELLRCDPDVVKPKTTVDSESWPDTSVAEWGNSIFFLYGSPAGSLYYLVTRLTPTTNMSNPNSKSIAFILTIAFVAALVGLLVEPEHPGVKETSGDLRVARLLSDVSTDSLMQTVRVLASEHSRRFMSKGATAAADYITSRLTDAGYGVEHQFINVEAPDGSSIVVTNILCDLGTDATPSLLLCAHYDSRGEFAADLAPGADDNASGVAVLIETARVFAKHHVKANVRLAFFGGEEDAFIGSQGYVDDIEGTLAAATINVDMVGYDQYGPLDMVVFSNKASLPVAKALEDAANSYTHIEISTRMETTGNSDHVAFWERGLPAVSLWEGYDHNPYYHTEEDVVEHLSPIFLTEVACLVTAVAFRMGVSVGDQVGFTQPPRLTFFHGASNGITQRFIGERLVEALPALESQLTILTYKGRVLKEWLVPANRIDPRVLPKAGQPPGVYLLSQVVDDTSVPIRAIVVE